MKNSLLVFEELSSTQDQARTELEQGSDDIVWVQAKQQKQGRGRQGRAWQSHPGDLLVSCALRLPPSITTRKSLATLVAGQVLWRALGEERDLLARGLFLKWPNDLFLKTSSGFQKIAGILGESPKVDLLILGWGVNLSPTPKHLPTGTPYTATSLNQLEIPISAEKLIEKMQSLWDELFQNWLKNPETFQNELIQNLNAGAMKPFFGLRGEWLPSRKAVRAIEMDSEGRLVVESLDTNERVVLSSGEFQLR